MSKTFYIDEETKQQWRYAFEQACNDRPRYFKWIQDEMSKN